MTPLQVTDQVKCPVALCKVYRRPRGTGAKGKRYTLHTRILLHQPYGGAEGQAVDIEIQAREIVRNRELMNEIIARHTGQPIERVSKDTDRDFILTAERAVGYGAVDEIITGRSLRWQPQEARNRPTRGAPAEASSGARTESRTSEAIAAPVFSSTNR